MQTVLVTGAAAGIGRATARRFANSGWRVYAADVDTDGLEGLEGCETATLDVTDGAAVDRLFDRISADVGGLDCVVANAGYCQPGPLEDLPAERLDRQFDVNVHGTLRTITTGLPLLRERDGTAVVVSSTHGRVVTPGMGAYAGSKHAIEGMVDALRIEVADGPVDVTLVEPAWVDTGFSVESDHLLSGFERSDRYADIYDAVEGDALLGGGPLAVSPERVASIIQDAATADDPAARYPVGLPARLVLATRWLPRPVQDLGQRVTIRALAALERVREAIDE
ncbi:SDR family NAD(P)-dependent oxidoreductase [Halorhabdus sp. BNX81]|uniref:SDR family NAD(P)-dependent oxidoreductase n=1 Tax=Halorhabdus sp. BNX81 TaxID=2980181 RepID=UPI0023DD55FC|nr:SDR family NAD(P)-dependent oxidoreductase [Halorhabdus sp. BNX81]